jgi:hypothetical protein
MERSDAIWMVCLIVIAFSTCRSSCNNSEGDDHLAEIEAQTKKTAEEVVELRKEIQAKVVVVVPSSSLVPQVPQLSVPHPDPARSSWLDRYLNWKPCLGGFPGVPCPGQQEEPTSSSSQTSQRPPQDTPAQTP